MTTFGIRRLTALPIFALLLLSTEPVTADAAQDYCQYGSRKIIILVDRTTAYDEVDKRLFVDGLEKIFESFQLGDQILVFTIASDYAQSAKTFDQCRPGCPEGGVRNWFFGSCRPLEAQATLTKFKRDLAQHIRQMLDDIQEYPHSDIARTIALVTQGAAGPSVSGDASAPVTSLFMFSDLIENSELLPWPKITTTPVDKALSLLERHGIVPKLAGAKVFAFGFGRLHDKQRTPLGAERAAKVEEFWRAFFLRGGASEVHIDQGLN